MAFICERAFVKIECFKIPTRRFSLSILGGGGGGGVEHTTEQTSLSGSLFNLVLNIFLFSPLI